MSGECPDTGTCHHSCPEVDGERIPCWRVANCGPLSIHAERWTHEELSKHGATPQPMLGARVRFTEALRRRALDLPVESKESSADDRKVWVERKDDHSWLPPVGPLEGVLIGVRTLSNGIRRWHDYDHPMTYHPTEHFEAYLIVTDLRGRPVHVLPKHVEFL